MSLLRISGIFSNNLDSGREECAGTAVNVCESKETLGTDARVTEELNGADDVNGVNIGGGASRFDCIGGGGSKDGVDHGEVVVASGGVGAN